MHPIPWQRRQRWPSPTLSAAWAGLSVADLYPRVNDIYLRTIAARRTLKIIIALRRYKDQHGRWPKSLDEIKSLAPPEVFVDPINGDSFVYKLADDTFRLYSKGKNKIDEDGQWNVTLDPNTYESTQREDDRLFWPLRMPRSKEDAEPNQAGSPAILNLSVSFSRKRESRAASTGFRIKCGMTTHRIILDKALAHRQS